MDNKQKKISFWLVLTNMALIYFFTFPVSNNNKDVSEDDLLFDILWILISYSALIGGCVFYYKKNYVVLILFIIITILYSLFLLYISALTSAFIH